jgi:hypothetical protein
MSLTNRRPSGKLLLCIAVTDTISIGVSSLDELATYGLKRPSQIEDAKKKDLEHDEMLDAARHVRETVQRRFDKARRARAVGYQGYIAGLTGDHPIQGAVPPITLYCPAIGRPTDDGLLLPHTSPLVTLDGETQTEARFALRESTPESGAEPVMFVLYHGIGAEHAGNIMHDFNVYAHPVAETKVSALNRNGALTSIVLEALEKHNVPEAMIQRHRRTPSKNQLTSFECLIAGTTGATLGVTALQGLRTHIARLNTKSNGIDREAVKPFVLHALGLAQKEPAIGRSRPDMWALAGGLYHDKARLLSSADWLTMQAAYLNTKPARGTRNIGLIKRNAAFKAIRVDA